MVADPEWLSIPQAVERYQVSASMLAFRLRIGEIPGEKVAGARNKEWRVAAADLEAAGYPSRWSEVEMSPRNVNKALRSLHVALNEQQRRCAEQANELERLQSQLRALADAINASPKTGGSSQDQGPA